jgi:glucose/arabinose dehydrogenase
MALCHGPSIGTVWAQAAGAGSEGVLVTVASGLNQPIGLMSVPGDDSRLFVIGKTGVIYTLNVNNDGHVKTYTTLPTPAIDLTSLVYPQDNRGLLGMAFPADYQTSGNVYLFTNTLATGLDLGMIVRYQRDAANPDRFAPASRQVIFSAPVGIYHHGGCLRFGPDGFLYFSKGDEGNIGILQARNPGTYYGKILRLDVTRDDFPLDPLRNYGIPEGNPFAHTAGGLPEVWAEGLRSPWQFSFDRQTGDIWVGDVGESSWEEVTCLPAGHAPLADFGWPSYEGNAPGPFGTMGADPTRVLFPAYVYPHQPQGAFDANHSGCSVDGGYVYRGALFPSWRGRYFWSDFCTSRIFSGVRGPDGHLTDVADMTAGLTTPEGSVTPAPLSNVVAFGEDNAGELFVCEIGGRVRKIVPRTAAADIGRAGGLVGPDGELDNNDFIVFINWFFSADTRCDIGSRGGQPGGDGVFDNNDLIVYVNTFFQTR